MIELTRTDSRKVIVNAELIEYIESTPDVVITLTNGNKILVKEKSEEIVKRIISYKRKCNLANSINID